VEVLVVKEARGLRNKNPFNLRKSKDKWQGLASIQSDKEFFQFLTDAYGIRAGMVTLTTYQDRYGLNTVEGIINRFAPPVENNTKRYIAAVSQSMGVQEYDKLDLHDPDTMFKLAKAIIKHENGAQPYSDAVLKEALVLAGIKPKGSVVTTNTAVAGGAGAVAVGTTVINNLDTVAPIVTAGLQYAPWLVAAVFAVLIVGFVVYKIRGMRDSDTQ